MTDPLASLLWIKWPFGILFGVIAVESLVLLVLFSMIQWQASELRSDVQKLDRQWQEIECQWREVEHDLKTIRSAGQN